MEKHYQLLQKSALFENMAEGDIASMLKCLNAVAREFEDGMLIFQEGQRVGAVGIVLKGTVQIIKEDVHGNRVILTECAPGDIFAEAFAPADIESIPVSVLAVKNCNVLFLDFKRIITQCSSQCVFHSLLIRNMMKAIARKNILLRNRIDLLGKRSIRERVLTYLWEQSKKAKKEHFAIPFSRNELADYLCVDRSALSRVLGQLQEEGILSFHKNEFKLDLSCDVL